MWGYFLHQIDAFYNYPCVQWWVSRWQTGGTKSDIFSTFPWLTGGALHGGKTPTERNGAELSIRIDKKGGRIGVCPFEVDVILVQRGYLACEKSSSTISMLLQS